MFETLSAKLVVRQAEAIVRDAEVQSLPHLPSNGLEAAMGSYCLGPGFAFFYFPPDSIPEDSASKLKTSPSDNEAL